ncbi:MAG: iron ABC transporter permease [Burkholderiales bacterium]|nr:iron ABC transporter permease [Burkholderiales bacterium]
MRPGVGARLRAEPALALAIAILWVLIALFIVYPIAMLLARVFVEDGHFTLTGIAAVLTDRHQVVAFWNSLLLGTLVGVIGTAFGFIFAFAATRCRLSPTLIRLIDVAVLLPLVSPPFTMAIGYIFSFGARGLITYDLLGIKGAGVYGMTSTMTAEAATYFPIAYLALRPMIAAIDSNIEGMALSLGASRWRVFRTVTLPLCIPGLANSFLLLFAASLADFATPLILAGNQFPVLPTQAFLQITGLFDLRGGAALSLMLLVPALLVFVAQRYWVGRGHYVTVTGKGAGQAPFDSVTPVARWTLVSLCVAVTLFIVYLYVLLLYASLVVAFGANEAFTLQHYRVVFTEGLRVLGDTLIIAAIATPLGGFYGVLLGYLVARKRFVGRTTMEITSMVNYALPGTIVGIGYLIAFNDPPIVLAGGALIIIACYVFRYGATGIRTTIAMMQQLDRSLEEASESLGASSSTTFRRVTLPLILPAFFAGLGVMFIRSMTAISATIFVVSLSWTLVTVKILENMTELALGVAAAFSVVVVAIVFIVIFAIGRVLRRLRAAGASAVTGLLAT